MSIFMMGQALAVAFVWFFRLKWWALSVAMLGSLIATIYLRDYYAKEEKEKERFFQLTEYIQAVGMSFMLSGSEYTALEESIALFQEGSFKESLKEALSRMQLSRDGRGSEEAFRFLQRKYPCKRLETFHQYLLLSAKVGGKYESGIRLLLRDLQMWKKRQMLSAQELGVERRKIKVAIVLTIVLCGYVVRLASGEVALCEYAIYQVGMLAYWLGCLMLYVFGERLGKMQWFDEQARYSDDVLYKKLMRYQQRRKDKKSTYGLEDVLKKELFQEFTEWILEVVLRMESKNVEVALEETYDTSPVLIQYFLARMLRELKEQPAKGEPFFMFARELRVPEIATSMKLLYGISKGALLEGRQQMEELIDRNYEMQNQVREHKQERKRSMMYGYALIPSLLGAGCMILNMTLLLMGFVENLQI